MFPGYRTFVGVWVLPSHTMEQVDEIVRTKYKVPEVHWWGETMKPNLMMHRFGRTAPIEWDVTVEEAKSKHFRYQFLTDISDSFNDDGDPPLSWISKNNEPAVFTKEWLKNAENQPGDGLCNSKHIYELS